MAGVAVPRPCPFCGLVAFLNRQELIDVGDLKRDVLTWLVAHIKLFPRCTELGPWMGEHGVDVRGPQLGHPIVVHASAIKDPPSAFFSITVMEDGKVRCELL